MRAQRSWFSFSRVPDATHHEIYNAYHQLDDRPENLALPGVLFGDRWVATPDCQAVTRWTDPRFEGAQYLVEYLFTAPLAEAVESWLDLSRSTFQEGRRPETGLVERPFGRWFTPLRTYLSPSLQISPEALVFRPVRGVGVRLMRVDPEAGPDSVQRALSWLDRKCLPAMVACPGVAGATVHTSAPEASTAPGAPRGGERLTLNDDPNLRMELYLLDESPIDAFTAMCEAGEQLSAESADGGAGVLQSLYEGPLVSIEPWRWDWFDAAGGSVSPIAAIPAPSA